MAEIRVFHEGQFLCRAICPDLAGETVSLSDIISARRKRKRELRQTIKDRKKLVRQLIELKSGTTQEPVEGAPSEQAAPKRRLKLYFNE